MSAAVAIDVTTGTTYGARSDAAGLDSALHSFNRQLAARRMAASQARADGKVLRLDSHPRYKANVRRLDAFLRGERGDDFDPGLGLATARELEHRFAEVLRETFPESNSARLFHVDPSVPPGKRSHTVARYYQTGSAKVHRTGEEIPMVGMGKAEESQAIRHYVAGFQLDVFDEMSAGVIDVNAAAELLRTVREAIDRFANLATWYGLPESGIYGVLSYPWLPVYIESQAFNASATTTDMVDALHRIANQPSDTNKAAFAPDKMGVGHRLYNLISTKQMSVDNSDTVLETFLRNSKTITAVESCWELDGVGPGGTDGILVYREDRLGVSNVVVQPFTPAPMFQRGFEREQVAYMTHGGVWMREVGNNLLAWVEGPAA